MDADTPRLVYRWFLNIYRICYSCAASGYAAVMLDFFGFSDIFMDREHHMSQLGTYLLFYGLYFGVMGRDFAEVCADRLATRMGYSNAGDRFATRALPPNTCAICAGELPSMLEMATTGSDAASERKVLEDTEKEGVVTLNCRHRYHEFCIRGWMIIGKKDTCPYCNEKVDLKKTFTSPWQKTSIMWANLLDMVRYLVVWNPVIIMITQQLLLWMGFAPHNPPPHDEHHGGAAIGDGGAAAALPSADGMQQVGH